MNLGERPVAEAGISYATAVAKIIGLAPVAMIPWWKAGEAPPAEVASCGKVSP
jgi:hypothetical protein